MASLECSIDRKISDRNMELDLKFIHVIQLQAKYIIIIIIIHNMKREELQI